MKHVLMLIVAMVLLSGAALGEGKYQGPPKDVLIIGGMNGPKELTMEWHIANMHPEWVRSGDTVYMWYEHKKPNKFRADDPTAWKQTDSKYGAEEDCFSKCRNSCGNHGPLTGKIKECYDNCLSKCQEPWADSRYRLEKNEVTGRYRISEFQNETWLPILCPVTPKTKYGVQPIDPTDKSRDDVYFDGPCRDFENRAEADESLEIYRRLERKANEAKIEDKAWRPIK